jgi:hypothetical protein
VTRKREKYLFATAEALARGEQVRLEPLEKDPPSLPCRTCEGHGFVDSNPCSACDGTGALVMSDEDVAILRADEKYDRDRGK